MPPSQASSADSEKHPPSMLSDLRIIFATILTDAGSSLAYGADALITVLVVLLVVNYTLGSTALLIAGGIIMLVYLLAILVYNSMTRHHVHRQLGGGGFVSALITSSRIRRHPRLKKSIFMLGKLGTASLLADFPATQAISLFSGVEALTFVKVEDRFKVALIFLLIISVVQRYGIGNLSRLMIWPILGFYSLNLGINAYGIYTIFLNGWTPADLSMVQSLHDVRFWAIIFAGVANGSTLITGVEVGYSSVNIPYHKGKAIRRAMWILYGIVFLTYTGQLINFLGAGVVYDPHIPVPLQIATKVGGPYLAMIFGILTAAMLLLAAQTAQTDFPLELLRGARSNFFPRGIGDVAWRKTKPAPVIGGHEGVHNPRATLLLGLLTVIILYFFPSSHHIEAMYGLAVVTAMNIGISAYLIRQIRAKKISLLTLISFMVMLAMFVNIVYNKFFEGAWFIVVLMALYMIIFQLSEAIYDIWNEKLDVVPLEFGLWYPAFQNLEVDRKHILLVSKFHPGVIHFLKSCIPSKKMPLTVHFATDSSDEMPSELPHWFKRVPIPENTDTISAITQFIKEHKPDKVHIIPLLVRGLDPILHLYFGNSIERLKHAISKYADLQVEYNRERVVIRFSDIMHRIFPSLLAWWKDNDNDDME